MIRELYAELLALVATEEGKEDHRFKHWAKRVDSVDASQKGGWVFKGKFINEGTVECEGPDVYLVCTRRGSRNYQTATYNVVLMNALGELALTDIQTTDKTKGWALRIRDEVTGLVTVCDPSTVRPDPSVVLKALIIACQKFSAVHTGCDDPECVDARVDPQDWYEFDKAVLAAVSSNI